MRNSDSDLNTKTEYPVLKFNNNNPGLENDEKATIATIASKLKANPDSRIIIKGYPETSKSSQALCQKRVDAIKKRMIEKEGISADRITTICEIGGGKKNTVEIISN